MRWSTRWSTLCVAVCQQFRLHAWDIFGHWDFYTTDCPGIAFYRDVPDDPFACRGGDGTSTAAQIPARRWPDIWRFVDGPVVGSRSTSWTTSATR